MASYGKRDRERERQTEIETDRQTERNRDIIFSVKSSFEHLTHQTIKVSKTASNDFDRQLGINSLL